MMWLMVILHLLLVLIDNSSGVKPNFVLFLTDDQDLHLDGMLPMHHTIRLIANEGLTFQEAYVHSPICCPSRSALLTGKYLHNLHVHNNSLSGNCSSIEWQNEHERRSVAALLQQSANYVNFYAGKYLNQYGSKEANGLEHVPRGYDWWYGLEGNSKYYNFTLSVNGTPKVYNKGEYLTDLMKQFAEDFLVNKSNGNFFMTLGTPAAHAPFTPAKRHEGAFPQVRAKRTPSFNFTAKNKHWLVGDLPPHYLPSNIDILDDIQRRRMQTLLAVDELVEFTVNKLQQVGVLNNTYLIFTSDNGFHIGQFALPWDKRQPYQTDVHIPFLMSGPRIPKKKVTRQPISLVDLTPTILELADVDIPEDIDGQSFASLLHKPTTVSDNMKTIIYVEYFGEASAHSVQDECNFTREQAQELAECTVENWCKCQDSRNNTYLCVVDFKESKKFKYCQFEDEFNFVEAYDLCLDQYELDNLAFNNKLYLTSEHHLHYQRLLHAFKQCTGRSCHQLQYN